MNRDSGHFMMQDQAGTIIRVHVQPRASKTELAGVHEGCLKIRLAAPPVEGKANKECIRFLSKLFSLPKSSIVILQGQKSRHKTFLLCDLEVRQAESAILEKGVC